MSDKKKKIIKGFIIICVVLLLMFIVMKILEKVDESNFETPELDYEFYVPLEDEETNIYLDKAYMAKDRILYYTDEMGQTWHITEESSNSSIGVTFFSLYFKYLELGDEESLNELLSDKLEKYGDFTMQRVYAKEVKFLNSEKIDDQTYSITYSLDYNIMKNDGSFRRDIGSDMSRTQYVTVNYNNDGDVWIEDIKNEYRK